MPLISLECRSCGNPDCDRSPVGSYPSEKATCRKQVSDDIYIRYVNLLLERWPCIEGYPRDYQDGLFHEIDSFLLEEVYPAPFAGKDDVE